VNEEYDNSKCRADEHCGGWEEDGRTLHGCILSKLCATTGQWTGNTVDFTCPSSIGRETPIK